MAASRVGRTALQCFTRTASSTIRTARPFQSSRISFRCNTQQRFASYQRFPGPGGRRGSGSGPTERIQYLWMNYRPVIIGVGGIGGTIYVFNIETVPISGRRRFNVITPAMESSIVGDSSYKEMLQQYQGKVLPASHPQAQRVARVVERLLPAIENLAGREEWAVHVIDEPDNKNAFVLPGGKVFVFTGILPICQDDDGLATVLGHEIAHNVAHHVAERLSKSGFILVFTIAAAALFDISGQTAQFVTNLVLSLPNSRTQEAEADHIGLLIMAESCFNPEAAVDFWRRMGAAEKGSPPQFLSTHPSSNNRMERIQSWMPEADNKRDNSACGSLSSSAAEFKKILNPSTIPSRQMPYGMGQQPGKSDEDFW